MNGTNYSEKVIINRMAMPKTQIILEGSKLLTPYQKNVYLDDVQYDIGGSEILIGVKSEGLTYDVGFKVNQILNKESDVFHFIETYLFVVSPTIGFFEDKDDKFKNIVVINGITGEIEYDSRKKQPTNAIKLPNSKKIKKRRAKNKTARKSRKK